MGGRIRLRVLAAVFSEIHRLSSRCDLRRARHGQSRIRRRQCRRRPRPLARCGNAQAHGTVYRWSLTTRSAREFKVPGSRFKDEQGSRGSSGSNYSSAFARSRAASRCQSDGSGNIQVNLDSSTPYGNDAILSPILVSFRTFVVPKSLLSTGVTVTSISAIESLRVRKVSTVSK